MSRKLGELLVAEGACAPSSVVDALKNQVIFGGRLGTNLLELGAVGEEALARALGRQHGVPALHGELALDAAATALLRPEIADRFEAVPYAVADRRLGLLVVDPKDLAMLDEVAFATGKSVHPVVVPEARVWALLRQTYGIDRHLRGIDVEFARLQDPSGAPPLGGVVPVAEPLPSDLMDESAFQALYSSAPAPERRAGPPDDLPDDVVELTDLIEPEPEPAPGVPSPAAPPPAPAEVLAALAARPGHAPPARLLRPVPSQEPEPSPLSFAEAVRFLEGVEERGAIARTVLRYARSKFARAVLLTVHRGAAHGWAGLGEKLGADAVRRIHLRLGTPGIVDTVVRTRAHLLGPIPKTEANIRLLKALGGGVPANAFLVPILAMGRVVNVFYADAGRGALLDGGAAGELLILATRIAKSYDALLARVR